MTPFTIVIVLHDSGPELAALLPTLERHAPDAQLIVVDTGSRDDGPALARTPRRRARRAPDNPGFGAANNAGVARARHDVTVLLNPDTELVDDSLHELAALARIHPRALHAPRLLEPDGPSSAPPTRCPAPSARCCPRSCTRRCCRGAARARRALPRRAAAHRRLGDRRVPGGRTDLLRELGPFDPAVHLFAEDMELGLRARARGIPTVLHPQLRVRHTAGTASSATASRSRCSPAAAARPSGRRSDRAPARSTTPPSWSPSPPGSRRAPRCGATPPASGRSWRHCAGKSGASRKGESSHEA